jgi:hypothetical protein
MRVWVIAENNQLKKIVSNKQKLWAEIIERLNACELDLIDKKDFLEVTTYPNWIKDEEMNLEGQKKHKAYRKSFVYSFFKNHKHIKICMNSKEDQSLTIWEREVH